MRRLGGTAIVSDGDAQGQFAREIAAVAAALPSGDITVAAIGALLDHPLLADLAVAPAATGPHHHARSPLPAHMSCAGSGMR